MRRVILAPGHWPGAPGAVDRYGNEYEIAAEIVGAVQAGLEEMRDLYRVFVAPPLPLGLKVREVNAHYSAHASVPRGQWLYVAVHLNSALLKERAKARGVNGHEVYAAHPWGRAWRAAQAIEVALCDLKTRARGVKLPLAHWWEVYRVGPPSVLVEAAFIWETILCSGGGRRMIGGLIAQGINAYFESEGRRL